MTYLDHSDGQPEDHAYRSVGWMLLVLVAVAVIALVLGSGCGDAAAQEHRFVREVELTDKPATDPKVDEQTGPPAEAAVVEPPAGPDMPAPGEPIGCAHDPLMERVKAAAIGIRPEERPLEHPAPFDQDWLTVAYGLDSRDDTRNLSLEGHSRVAEDFDVAGQLDIWSSLDHDPSRFSLRSGVYGRIAHGAGLVAWYEEFTGSSNSTVRVGAYRDVGLGGTEPFCRLVALPFSSEGRGPMACAIFDVALYERWSLGGFAEVAWDDDEGTWVAAEPELRYEVRDGVWATLEYRRDERWQDVEGLAVGVRASL